MKLTNAANVRHETGITSMWEEVWPAQYEDDMVAIIEAMYVIEEPCQSCDNWCECRGGYCDDCARLYADPVEWL